MFYSIPGFHFIQLCHILINTSEDSFAKEESLVVNSLEFIRNCIAKFDGLIKNLITSLHFNIQNSFLYITKNQKGQKKKIGVIYTLNLFPI